ncbi:XRE family transcriptional regulator [Pararcticibacter amylolyticus]|uniref:HTH cro/C1-type domain-containing protein n=1 Tax=Pararcticibacter amylolyticus TaxID=2173175 RepID=A0A2U2PC12_9SPHI|nr:LexA family transcriptional regulator [Pararcticibacter amylolyticus]PWG78883.1 hypothetical protein DDR33_19695 [Pararcticibacter amylolyticus]
MQEILSKISIATRIKDLRHHAGLSQAEVAQRLNISRSNYSQIELGNQFPTFEVLYRLASFYSKSYEWFLHGSDDIVKDEFFFANEHPGFIKPDAASAASGIQLILCRKREHYIRMATDGNPKEFEVLPDIMWKRPGLIRAFEVEGDSMRNALFSGDIVIARFISSPAEIEDRHVYVLVTGSELLIERVLVSNKTSGVVICISDADPLARRILLFDDIKEIWRAEGKYSEELSYAVEDVNKYISHFETTVEKLRLEIEKIRTCIGENGGGLVK